tara:strand:- start:44926 stop:46893 length:1968 start_codon:yes stop_codon:yes gene_type:complete
MRVEINLTFLYNITKLIKLSLFMSIKLGKHVIDIPQKTLIFRSTNERAKQTFLDAGETPLTSLLAANRVNDMSSTTYQELISPSLADMDIASLKDVDIAAERLLQAKERGERIALATDFDVDGITSAVVMKLALVKFMGFPDDDIVICVNNRMKFGYGITKKAVDAIIERCGDRLPSVVMTADQGSGDSEGFAYLKERMDELGSPNVDVIVSDHHHTKGSCPEAYAFINPQRPDDNFKDKTICGCVVALCLMTQTAKVMAEAGYFGGKRPSLAPLMTYASLATVADCVSLQSGFNRRIIRKGIDDINREVIPAWTVLKRKINKPFDQVNVEDLGFLLAPAINADSRTGGDGSSALGFLMAESIAEAEIFYEKLLAKNNRRKEVDASMQEEAFKEASRQYYELGRRGISLYLPKGSHGIHGIVASRVKEAFNCPTIIFSPVDVKEKKSDHQVITGSGRSIDGPLNIRDIVFNDVKEKVSVKGGGHKGAMGVKIKLGDLSLFQEEFDKHVKNHAKMYNLSDDFFAPRVMIDKILGENDLARINEMSILDEINRLHPYGQLFEAPAFAINCTFAGTIGHPFGNGANQGAHCNFKFKDQFGNYHKAVAFHFARQPWFEELAIGETYTVAVKIGYSSFDKGPQLLIESIIPGINSVEKAG